MNVQKRNDVSIYCLSSGTSLPEWLGDQAKRNLAKRDESIRRRIELIQDFSMPASSSKLMQSPDGRYIIAAGTYPPRIRCYDIHELTMKFERYLEAGVVDMAMLGEDYGKFALLLDDRTVAFHAPYGAHESVRIPTFGRAMAYEPSTCEILVAAKGNQMYRINLEEGRFSVPWTFEPSDASGTCITVNPCHPLASVGCDDGIVRFWDSRVADSLLKPFLRLDVQSATAGFGFADEVIVKNPAEITSIAHDASGLYMAAGTAGGLVALYDVRSSRPLHIQEHKHGLPIHTVKFHSSSGMILSSDEKLIKAWRYKSSVDAHKGQSLAEDKDAVGSVLVNVEGTGKLSHFITAGDEKDPTGDRTGIILCATDQPKMESYYIPALGVAPKWCSFLENITEELEERDLEREGADELIRSGKETIYENYKFVSQEDVEKLGISNLIGTPLLRGYMHGFFMDINLYNRVKAVANPFEYEQYQKKKLKERLEAKRASRIAPRASDRKSKKVEVNAELAERLQDKAEASTKAGKVASNLLSDDRFGSLFTNPAFQINEEDEDFKLRNPSGVAAAKQKRQRRDMDSEDEDSEDDEAARPDLDERYIASSDESGGGSGEEDHSSSDDSDSDEDGFHGGKIRGEAYKEVKVLKQATKRKKKVSMYEADELEVGNAVKLGRGKDNAEEKARRRLEEMNMPISKRFAREKERSDKIEVRVEKGSKEATFIPKDTLKKMEAAKASREEGGGRSKRKRRDIKELRLKTPFRNHR